MCHFEWPWVDLSNLAKYSMAWSTRSLSATAEFLANLFVCVAGLKSCTVFCIKCRRQPLRNVVRKSGTVYCFWRVCHGFRSGTKLWCCWILQSFYSDTGSAEILSRMLRWRTRNLSRQPVNHTLDEQLVIRPQNRRHFKVLLSKAPISNSRLHTARKQSLLLRNRASPSLVRQAKWRRTSWRSWIRSRFRTRRSLCSSELLSQHQSGLRSSRNQPRNHLWASRCLYRLRRCGLCNALLHNVCSTLA